MITRRGFLATVSLAAVAEFTPARTFFDIGASWRKAQPQRFSFELPMSVGYLTIGYAKINGEMYPVVVGDWQPGRPAASQMVIADQFVRVIQPEYAGRIRG